MNEGGVTVDRWPCISAPNIPNINHPLNYISTDMPEI